MQYLKLMIFPVTLFDRYTFYLNFSNKYREFDEILRPYIADYHVIEKALKERYLTGQSVRAVIFADI